MEQVVLQAAAIVAAFFQSVVGIGFGMVAGPVVLLVLEDPAAVLISTCMSWLIALVLFPWLRRDTDWGMMLRLTSGAALGILPGVLLLGAVGIDTLKLVAGMAIAGLTGAMVFGLPGMRSPGRAGDVAFGALAGAFGGCLAIPGPPAALRMTGLARPKTTVRATMVSFFCAVWPMILAAQVSVLSIGAETWWNALSLVPGTLAGLAIGNWAASCVSEAFFRRMVTLFLLAAAASLLAASL
ncbi:MAG: sulfite exporter TauE/SafE family protein [Pseudomonadota bacterium]